MKVTGFGAGEYIYHEGDLTAAVRTCQKGKVALIRSDGVIEDMLTDGAYFGIQSLLAPGPAPNSAVGLSNCDIMILSRSLISSCMQQCPTSAAVVRKNFGTLCAS